MSTEYKDNSPSVEYHIRVRGKLDVNWSEWFNGLTIRLESEDPPVTVLSGEIVDQSRLRGILNRLWDLNLTILSVNNNAPNNV